MQTGQLTLLNKIWREASRPFRASYWSRHEQSSKTAARHTVPTTIRPAESSPKPLELSFDAGTVEPAGLAFLNELVRRSQAYPGPIIEIGTLFGSTATHMALNKAPEQRIITVDAYSWNPWNLSAESHYQLTSRMLGYLVQSGHVEIVKQDKNEFYRTYRGPAPSLVFLDAVHTYEETKRDIEWAKSVGTRLIAGHDYCDRFPGVQQIVQEQGGPSELGGTVFLL